MSSSASPPSTAPSKPALASVTSISPVRATVSISVPIPVTIPLSPVSEGYGAFFIVVEVMPAHRYRTGVFFLLLNLDLGLFEVLVFLPLGVCAVLAFPSLGTETCQVIWAHLLADMLLGAAGAQWTEAAVVVRAGWQLALRVDVEVEALVAVAAKAIPQKEVALGHLAQVEFV